MRKILVSAVAGLALTGGTLALGTFGPIAAFAQDKPAATQPAAPDGAGQSGEAARKGNGHLRRHIAKLALKDAADTIGIPAQDLAAALRGGQSVADVATAHGVDPQTVIDKLSADAVTKIDQAVAEGKLTAQRAAKLKTKVPERVTTLVNRHFDGSHKPGA